MLRSNRWFGNDETLHRICMHRSIYIFTCLSVILTTDETKKKRRKKHIEDVANFVALWLSTYWLSFNFFSIFKREIIIFILRWPFCHNIIHSLLCGAKEQETSHYHQSIMADWKIQEMWIMSEKYYWFYRKPSRISSWRWENERHSISSKNIDVFLPSNPFCLLWYSKFVWTRTTRKMSSSKSFKW